MNFFALSAVGGGALWLWSKFKKGKAAYDLGIQLESVRVVKWQTGYATLGVKFRLTNKNDTPVTLENYSVKVRYLETELANGVGELHEATVPAHGQAFVEFQFNTANYTSGLMSLLIDIFSNTQNRNKIYIDYCIKVKGFPQFCDTDEYTL